MAVQKVKVEDWFVQIIKVKKIQHGNLNSDTNGIPMGFTNWYHYFWNEEQMINEGIPMVVNEWNSIHKI